VIRCWYPCTLLAVLPTRRKRKGRYRIFFSQSLFAVRTLRQHGLPEDALHEVFKVVVINKLTHASPAWWGFASADDRNRLETFLRKSVKLDYRAKCSTTFASICDDADCKLFTRITGNTQHLLYPLLPSERERHYTQSLRQRYHNFQLADCASVLEDKNLLKLKGNENNIGDLHAPIT